MVAASLAFTGWRKSMPATTPTKSGRAGLAGVMVMRIGSSIVVLERFQAKWNHLAARKTRPIN
jgi:hypothetical protein